MVNHCYHQVSGHRLPDRTSWRGAVELLLIIIVLLLLFGGGGFYWRGRR
jgi:hypothetical protein